jgi:ubiquinone biosynthesis protein Coq4
VHLALLLKSLNAMREGRFGDAGVYKAVALTAAPYPDTLNAVNRLSEPLPDFATMTSSSMPGGSLGQAFATFVAKYGITPLSISPKVRSEVAPLNIVAARYLLVHDVFHVLLGFDISRPGELAVWSFVAAQHYSRSYERAAALANVVYPLAEPSARTELRRQRAQAIELARDCACLIAQPLEQYWSVPLAEVRRELGIRSTDDA